MKFPDFPSHYPFPPSIISDRFSRLQPVSALSMCCQILSATLNKTAAVRPLTSHLSNDPSKTNKIFETLHIYIHICMYTTS